ncbi:hypothetical protein [Persicitalea sp.]|uniref:hypothetical protein n=1 Tax=Persicitalea sp. TaxID=3100273 RepID=UPI0035935E96
MKKTFKFLVPLAIALMVGCSKKDTAPSPMNCANSATKFSDALTAYAANPTKAGCEAYKKTVRDYIKSCAALYTAVDKKDLEEFLAEPCTE